MPKRTSIYLPDDVVAALEASPDSPAVILRRGLALPGEHEALALMAAEKAVGDVLALLTAALDRMRAGIVDDVQAMLRDDVNAAVRSAFRETQGGGY